jgi:hypothetical protein
MILKLLTADRYTDRQTIHSLHFHHWFSSFNHFLTPSFHFLLFFFHSLLPPFYISFWVTSIKDDEHRTQSTEHISRSLEQSCVWMQYGWGSFLCPSPDSEIYSSVQIFIFQRTPVFNEEIAVFSTEAEGSTGYRKVPCSAQSFDVAVKGCFDEGIDRDDIGTSLASSPFWQVVNSYLL